MDKLPIFSAIFQSIPEAIILVGTSLILLGYTIRKKVKVVVFIGVINSLILILIRSFFPFGFHTIIGLFAFSLTLWSILKIDLFRSFIIASFGIVLLGVLESLYIPFLSSILNLSMENILNSTLIRTFITYPHLVTLAIIGVLAERNNWSFIKIDSLVISKSNLALIIVVLLHLFFIAFFNLTFYFNRTSFSFNYLTQIPLIINVFFISSLLVAIISIKRLFSMAEKETLITTQEIYFKNVDDLFNSYRAQRHDFHNHLQAVYAMTANSGNNEAITYLDSVLDDFEELNDLVRLKHSALAALLKAKVALANSKHINLHYSIQTSLENIKIKPHELVNILGNLIDNAIEAIEDNDKIAKEAQTLFIEITRQNNQYKFFIANPGPIKEDNIEKIFDENFTTKNFLKHSGLGLSTVKKLVNKNEGEIILQSNKETGTQFTIILPSAEE